MLHKDDPNRVLKAFEKYFKPEQNQFHSWYTLGNIHRGQFKCQHDFLNRLREVAWDCSFTNVDEIVQFLLLTHNQNTRVREELLKTMKTTDSPQDTLQIAHLAEGTTHSENCQSSTWTQWRKMPKWIAWTKAKASNSEVKGMVVAVDMAKGDLIVASGTQVVLNQDLCNCSTKYPPKQCPSYRKSCFYCKKEGHFSKFCCTRAHSQSSQHKSRKGPQSNSNVLFNEIELNGYLQIYIFTVLPIQGNTDQWVQNIKVQYWNADLK